MKKIFYSLFSFVFGFSLCLGIAFFDNNFVASAAQEDEEIIPIPISSADEFISTFENSENYASGKYFQLTNDLNFEGKELPSIIYDTVFSGTLDGQGYTISNLTIIGGTQYYGLFGKAYGAVLKNIKLDGNIVFGNIEGKIDQVYVGSIVGYGENTTIQNCEISTSAKFYMLGEEQELLSPIEVQSVSSIGTIAGALVGGSKIENCITNPAISISLELAKQEQNTPSIYIGGVVGTLDNSKILRAVSYNNLTTTNNDNATAYVGGIAGVVKGDASTFYNCVYNGKITSTDTIGMMIGEVVPGVKNGNIAFSYWNNKDNQNALAIGEKAEDANFENIYWVENIDNKFLADDANWYKYSGPWDFDYTWRMMGSRLYLQAFQYFDFSFNTIQPIQIESYSFINEVSGAEFEAKEENSYSIKYGQPLAVKIVLKEQYRGYYSVSDVKIGISSLVDGNGNKLWNAYESSDGLGFVVSLSTVSNLNDGIYSFSLSSKEFECKIVTEDSSKGGVRTKDGKQLLDELVLNLSYIDDNSTKTVILAEGKGVYTFVNWELYYFDEELGDFSSTPQTFEQSSVNPLEIDFGKVEPFTKRFMLKAYFSDADAISVGFTNSTSDAINSIKLGGQDFTDTAIKVSSLSKSTLLEINVKAGYEMNIDNFVNFLKTYYGNNDPSLAVMEPVKNEDGTTTYKFSINMTYVSEKLQGQKTISFPLTFEKVTTDGSVDLLWLWISLPIVVVGGGLLAFFLIRRKRMIKNFKNKPQKEKSVDYRDYYQ